MSDVMLHGVLNMPPNIWGNSPIDVKQRHSRYVEASKRIEAQEEQCDMLADALKEIYNLSAFDWDTMPDEARKRYREVVSEIADKALATVKQTSL
jgi:hypothetical protein